MGAVVLVALNAHRAGARRRQRWAGRHHVFLLQAKAIDNLAVVAGGRRRRQAVMATSGVEGGVDGVGRERDSRRGRLLVETAGVRAVHGVGRALLVADGAVIVGPHDIG